MAASPGVATPGMFCALLVTSLAPAGATVVSPGREPWGSPEKNFVQAPDGAAESLSPRPGLTTKYEDHLSQGLTPLANNYCPYRGKYNSYRTAQLLPTLVAAKARASPSAVFQLTFRSFVTRPVGTHSTTKILPSRS